MVKRLLGILNILLITVLVFFGVRVFYTIVAAKMEESILFAALETTASGPDQNYPGARLDLSAQLRFSEYQPIVQRDLFLTKAAEAIPPPVVESDIADLEKTKLNLKLWGTITGDDQGLSYAVIEETARRQQPQHLYREGDRVGQASIKLILREKVVLTVDGRDEVLEMEQLADDAASASRPARRTMDVAPAHGIPEPGREVAIERDTIEDALSDVGNLMRQVRIRPYFQDGNPEGILLSGIRRGSIFEDMGLSSGDVITGVNGNPIRTVEDAMQLYEGLKSEQSVELQIMRDGAPQTISYRIN